MDKALKNTLVRGRVEGYSSEGLGVIRAPGAVFVPGAVRGDELEVKILKAGRDLSYGRIERVLSPSPERESPRCPLAGKCGGCDFQHMSEREELWLKRERVRDAFRRIAGISVEPDIVPSPRRDGYRNKAAFPVQAGEQGLSFGFYAPRSHRLAEADDCPLHPWEINECARAVRELCREKGVRPFDRATGTGFLRHILIRLTEHDLHVCLVAGEKSFRYTDELAQRLQNITPLFSGLSLNYNPEDTNRITGSELLPLWGSARLRHDIMGVRFSLSPLSFAQVNSGVAELLYREALSRCRPSGDESLLDLYCGAGSMTLPFARHYKQAVGVELFEPAVRDGRENARRNGIENVRFYCGDAPELAQRLKGEGFSPDTVVCDPPRKGIGPSGVRALLELAPKRIVYVSCDPATLARDVRELARAGYLPDRPTVFDMFPRTANVETVVYLSHQNAQ